MATLNLQDPNQSNYLEIRQGMSREELVKSAIKSNNNILATIISSENIRHTAYKDPANNIHIGIGYSITGKSNRELREDLSSIGVSQKDIRDLINDLANKRVPSLELTTAQSVQLAQRYIDKFERQVSRNVSGWDDLSENAKSALIHKAYQVGPNGLPKSFVKAIKEGRDSDLEKEALVSYRQSFDVDGVNVKVRTPDLRNAYISAANMKQELLDSVLSNTAPIDRQAKQFKDELNKQIAEKLKDLSAQGKLEEGKLYSLKDLGIKMPKFPHLSEMKEYSVEKTVKEVKEVKEEVIQTVNEPTVKVEAEPTQIQTVDSEFDMVEFSDANTLDKAEELLHANLPLLSVGLAQAISNVNEYIVSQSEKNVSENKLASTVETIVEKEPNLISTIKANLDNVSEHVNAIPIKEAESYQEPSQFISTVKHAVNAATDYDVKVETVVKNETHPQTKLESQPVKLEGAMSIVDMIQADIQRAQQLEKEIKGGLQVDYYTEAALRAEKQDREEKDLIESVFGEEAIKQVTNANASNAIPKISEALTAQEVANQQKAKEILEKGQSDRILVDVSEFIIKHNPYSGL